MERLNLFVSSKTDELREERKKIKSYFQIESFDVFVFEDSEARTESVEEVYKEQVLKCDIYIGVFKQKYSHATEEEYELASQNQKEILIYIANDGKKREPELAHTLLIRFDFIKYTIIIAHQMVMKLII